MAAQQGFRAINSEPFVYQENSTGFSAALGIDSTNVYSISVVGSPGASPNPTSQLVIIPGGNTTITPGIRFKVDGPTEITGGLQLSALAFANVSVLGTDAAGNVASILPAAVNTVLVSNGVGVAPSFQAVPATSGVISIAGSPNQITASAATGAVTLSIPATFIAPGTIASTTSLTAGSAFTVTAGAITLTPLSTSGIVLNSAAGVISTGATTNHAIQLGNSSGQLTSFSLGTSGQILTSGGAAADPAWLTVLPIANGGTNASSMTTTDGVVYFDGTRLVTTSAGTATQVLTSNGAGVAPTYQAVPAGGVISIAGSPNQISASSATGAVTLSTPSVFIAPGSIASTTTLAAGTNLLLPAATSTVGRILFDTGSNQTVMHTKASTGTLNVNFFVTDQATANYTYTGQNNIVLGADSGRSITSASDNIGIGFGVFNSGTQTGGSNIGLGNQAVSTIAAGTDNIGIGNAALTSANASSNNIAIGRQALNSMNGTSTSNNNIAIGQLAGTNLTSTGNPASNIYLNSSGVAAESNKLRIGSATGTGSKQLNAAFICGVYNTAVGATAGVALVDSTDQIGGLNGAAGTVLVGGTKPAFTTLSTLAVISIAGSPNQITASASTGAVTLSTPSTFIAPGTIASTTTNAAGTNFILPVTTASAGQILQNSVRVFHTFGTDNTFLGSGAGNLTLTTSERNVAIGVGAGASLSASPGHNVYVGYQAGNADDGTGGTNVAVGFQALLAFSGGTTPRNVAIGPSSLIALAGAGVHNTCLGYNTGSAYTTTESDNILIGYNTAGTIGESNVMRIGVGTGTSNGQVNKCFIAGIQGITVTGTAVLVSASDQLGIAISSRRFKDNIQDMDDYSSDLLKLRPVTFNYNIGDDQSLQSGLIAEEVADIMPQLVVNDQEGLPQTVKYHELPALLLNEIQKLNKRIQALEER